jgi:hypothetical protein
MRPIEYKADIEYIQALRCVEYRLPVVGKLQKQGYLLALGLRYGLVGIAATNHLLESATGEDERCVLNITRSWPRIVEDHVRYELLKRLPFPCDIAIPVAVGRYSERALRLALPLLHRVSTLEKALQDTCDQFCSEHVAAIRMNWPWYLRRAAVREFNRCSKESLSFALHFSERRQYDLEEVPEIALLGE